MLPLSWTTAAQPQVLPHHPLLIPRIISLGRRFTGLHGQTLSRKKKCSYISPSGEACGRTADIQHWAQTMLWGKVKGHAGRAPGDGIHHQNASRFHGGVSTPTVLQVVRQTSTTRRELEQHVTTCFQVNRRGCLKGHRRTQKEW